MVLRTKKKYGSGYKTSNIQELEEKKKEKNCTVIPTIEKQEVNNQLANNQVVNKKISDEKLKRFINFKIK